MFLEQAVDITAQRKQVRMQINVEQELEAAMQRILEHLEVSFKSVE